MEDKLNRVFEEAEYYLLEHEGKFETWEDWLEFKNLILLIVKGEL